MESRTSTINANQINLVSFSIREQKNKIVMARDVIHEMKTECEWRPDFSLSFT